jgi:hypothetical protein
MITPRFSRGLPIQCGIRKAGNYEAATWNRQSGWTKGAKRLHSPNRLSGRSVQGHQTAVMTSNQIRETHLRISATDTLVAIAST